MLENTERVTFRLTPSQTDAIDEIMLKFSYKTRSQVERWCAHLDHGNKAVVIDQITDYMHKRFEILIYLNQLTKYKIVKELARLAKRLIIGACSPMK